MSYENTQCPCGGEKPCSTMLCDDCNGAFAERPEMSAYQDSTLGLDYRRHAAIILLALARQRKRLRATAPAPAAAASR